MIGIMSAVPFEVSKKLLENLDVEETQSALRHDFYRGILAGHQVVVTTSGMGKVRAAARTQFLIDHYSISKIIFVGVAGALNPQLKIGDIVVSQRVIQHDFDITGSSNSEQRGTHWYYGDPELIQASARAAQKLGMSERLHLGKVLTGDQFISHQSRKEELRKVFGGDCCEMEGAAVAAVCWMNELPFVLIRGISDMADEQVFDEHTRSLHEVIESCTELVVGTVSDLP